MMLPIGRRAYSPFYVWPTLLLLCTALAGCGGGGGGGGGTQPQPQPQPQPTPSPPAASVTVTPSSLEFTAFENAAAAEPRTLTVAWTGANVAGFAIGSAPGDPPVPFWLGIAGPPSLPIGSTQSTVTFTRLPFTGLAPGTYSASRRIATGDINLNPIANVDVPVSLTVVARPSVTPSTLSMSWVESEQPPAKQLTVVGLDPRAQVVSATPNVPWLSGTVAGSTITIAATSAAQTVRPGQSTASVRVVFAIGGSNIGIDVPIAATVSDAFGGPAMSVIELEVNGSTQAADLLNRTATLSAVTSAPVQFNATSTVPWLTGGNGFTTGSPNNIRMSLQAAEIRKLAYGEHNGMLTITPTTPNISPTFLPVRLKVNLPEVRVVTPIAFTDTVATDYVVVHGRGLSQPNIDLHINGTVPATVTVVDDRTVHVIPGPSYAAQGDYPVTVENDLGFNRDSAKLRVTDPPAYTAASLDVVLGSHAQARIVSSPINHAVFTHQCYFCPFAETAAAKIHRFGYDTATGQWTHTEVVYDRLFDIALTSDESRLIVLEDGRLYLADPVTMLAAPEDRFDVPGFSGGISRQLAVAGDGLVLIGDSRKAFSLITRTFVDAPTGYMPGRGPTASADGSRVLMTFTNSSDPIQVYRPSTGAITAASASASDPLTSLDRHASTAFVNGAVFNADFSVRGQVPVWPGEVSPDGKRLYHPDVNLWNVRVFDITPGQPFGEELTAIAVPGISNALAARAVIDPRGKHLYYVTDQKFVVIPLP